MQEVTSRTTMENWISVCEESELIENIGVCALVDDEQVAIFKTFSGSIHAISNYDPFSDANVISRGICGDLKDQPVVASPIYKQHFNLETGQCLEDDSVKIPVYSVRVVDGQVQLSAN